MNISLIAFPGAPIETFKNGEEILKNKFQSIDIEFVKSSPDVLFILTGGSEMQAKELIQDKENILILAMTKSNSYAAATEIKAFCNHNNINAVLYNIDNDSDVDMKIEHYLKSIKALKKIKGYKVGLIGNVSEWLINSTIENSILKSKLGFDFEKIEWNDFSKYSSYPNNSDFINHFKNEKFDLEDSSKVYNQLQEIIQQKKLNAITVECFPLVQESAVTACLALSKFNAEGTPAGCEGDITAITGKIICKELTGQIPWMANLASIENDKVFFAHCTIATDLISDFTINTHFETNKGTAVQGRFKAENATVFRLNNQLNKAFLSYGRIVERPEREDSCRTQIKIELPANDIQKLKENPLGNHHLILPGDQRELIKYFLKLINIELV